MKTSVIQTPDIYRMQRTSDRYVNATHFLSEYNKSNNQLKILGNYMKLTTTSELIDGLIEEGIEKPFISARGSGEKAGTWMHPFLLLDFAMWLSVEFKIMALKWINDGLIQVRHEAGDYYNEMTAKILEKHIEIYGYKPSAKLFLEEARLIKEVANINKPRNEMTESELAKITTLQKVNTTLISDNVGRESRKKHLTIISRSI